MRIKSWGVLAGALVLAHVGAAFSGTNRWTETGPEASDVRAKFSNNPDIAYARGGDKLWKSTNGGQDWVQLLSKNASWYPFAVDPTDPNVVIIGYGFFTDGLLRSIDGGETFTAGSYSWFTALEFSADATVVYGANSNLTTPIVRSFDKGATWTTMASAGLPTAPGTANYYPSVRALGVERSNVNTVYAGYQHPDYQGVYRSLDAGASWTPASGLMGITVNEIVSHPSIAGRVFAATSAGLFRSNDTGATWSRVADPSTTGVATVDMQSVAFDRVDSQMLFAGGAQRGEIFFSADGGASWTRRDTGVLANRINSLAARPGHSGEVLAGTSHTLYRTTNSAQNWAVSASGLRAANITSLQSGNRLRAGLADGGIYESLDGTTWTPLNNAALRARLPNGRFSGIADILEGTNRLFVMPAASAVLTSTTLGNTWQPLPPSYPTAILEHWGGLVELPGSGSDYLAGSNNGIYRTADNGVTWTWSSSGLPATTIRDFARNADGSALYAATFSYGVYKSTNNGTSWVVANNGLTNLEIQVLEYDTVNDVLLVGTNHGLFASNDGGASYTTLTNPWPAAQMSVNGLVIEDFVHGAIYVGFQKLVYRSVDGGQSWTELSEGNPYTGTVIRITSMVSDGPGVLYLGNMYSGLQTYTVSPDVQIDAGPPANGALPIGTELPWQFIVRNAGPHASTFTQASWQVPANVDVLNLGTTRGNCSVSGSRRLNCDFGVLAVNQDATVTMTLRGNSGGVLDINVSAGSAEIDSAPANNNYTNGSVRFGAPVDLAATLTATPALVNSGSALAYTLVVSNNGPNAVTGGSFETSFDARDQYVLAQGSAAGCTGNVAGVQVCPLPPIATGASVTYRWTVTPQWGGARTPGVVVRADTQTSLDTNQANNTASATVNVVPITDLSTSITSAASTVLQGSPVALTATITNNSLIDAAGVTGTLTLSERMTFSSATGAVCTTTGNVVNCAVGVLGAGASRAITINVNAVSPGAAMNTFSALSAGPDPVLPNNSANVTVTVNPANDLSVTLAGAASATTGNTIVLTLTGNNLSANEATGVRAEVTLSALVTYASASGATCTVVAAVVGCDLGNIAGNASKVVSITVNAVTAGAATSGATITGANPDPNVANNAASVQTTLTSPPPSGGGSSSSGGGGGAFDFASVLALLGFLGWSSYRRRRSVS